MLMRDERAQPEHRRRRLTRDVRRTRAQDRGADTRLFSPGPVDERSSAGNLFARINPAAVLFGVLR
jgi:hypothetical protein